MTDTILFASDEFRMRPWQPGDEASLLANANNFNIWINLRDNFPHPYTLEDAQTWVQYAASFPNSLNLAIEVAGAACGGIGLRFRTDVHRRSAEIGYWLGEAYWNKGIVTEAVKLLSTHVFRHYDICRLYAGIFEYNQASMRVLEKAGYHLEAVHRQAVTKNGRTVDEHLFVLLK